MGQALLTDLYELTMTASYLKRGMTAPATFSLFIRDLPPGWGFFVSCGLEASLDWLAELRFSDQELEHLRTSQGFDEDVLGALAALRFTGEIRAIPEGRIAFPNEPLLEVTAPLPEAQLAETYLLNQITHQTAIASKAARCRLANPDAELVDFSFRRVHGVDAGISAARATAIAGFTATSNVEAARTLGLRTAGTMAHSYIEAFGSELDAFRAFSEDFPDRITLLVDTYDTTSGVENAITMAHELRANGHALAAIRLDSGDLGVLAHASRRALDEAGLSDVRIFASGAIDERRIAELADAPIDAFGVGSRVGAVVDAPTLDSAYKLVEYDGRPVAKLSTGKATLPGRKQVWRGAGGDIIGLADEAPPPNTTPLLTEVMRGGAPASNDSWAEARDRFADELERLPDALRSLEASPPAVGSSDALTQLTEEVRADIRRRELE